MSLRILLSVIAAMVLAVFVFFVQHLIPSPSRTNCCQALQSTSTMNRIPASSAGEYVSSYGYSFKYPTTLRLSSELMSLFSRSANHDDVVLLTSATKQEEEVFFAEARADVSKGMNLASDDRARTFGEKSILITPGLPGDLEYSQKRASISSAMQIQKLGFVAFDYADVKLLTSQDGTPGLKFTITEHLTAADTQSQPVIVAIFSLTRGDLFPEWNAIDAKGSSTIQLKMPSTANESTKEAFEQILSTMRVD